MEKLGKHKSPGPDGIPAEFYREFSNMIANELLRVYNEMYEEGALQGSFREGEIAFLYKKGDARDMRNYRPITLLNCDYKILTKMLAARLKRNINTIASPQQNGFVPRRSIFDNLYLSKLLQAYID